MSKVVEPTTEDIVVTDYQDGFQYTDEVIQFFLTSEGYVNVTSTKYKFRYVYNYKDHLGNVRLSFSSLPGATAPSILEESNYYPFGLKHENYNSQVYELADSADGVSIILAPTIRNKYQYKFNGKELQDELGLNLYDYGARNYDPAIGRWLNLDPLAETSRRFSPYTYALNNPVFFIDPDGMEATDWFKDLKGVMQFDPKVQSQADLGNKGTYVGDTDKQTTASGGTADFRSDGSIMYSKESDAYSRVMSNTLGTGREQNAIIGDKSVLVLPDYNNSASSGGSGTDLGYSFKNGNLQDPISGKEFNTIGSVHAHLSGGGPSTYTGDTWGDLGVAQGNTPNKPVFVMKNQPGTDGLGVIFSSPYVKGQAPNYRIWDVTKLFPKMNADNIQKGTTSLRDFTKNIDWKTNLKK